MELNQIYNLDRVSVLAHTSMTRIIISLVESIEHKHSAKHKTIKTVKTYSIQVHELVGHDEFGPIVEKKYYAGFSSKAKAKAAYKVFSY